MGLFFLFAIASAVIVWEFCFYVLVMGLRYSCPQQAEDEIAFQIK